MNKAIVGCVCTYVFTYMCEKKWENALRNEKKVVPLQAEKMFEVAQKEP